MMTFGAKRENRVNGNAGCAYANLGGFSRLHDQREFINCVQIYQGLRRIRIKKGIAKVKGCLKFGGNIRYFRNEMGIVYEPQAKPDNVKFLRFPCQCPDKNFGKNLYGGFGRYAQKRR